MAKAETSADGVDDVLSGDSPDSLRVVSGGVAQHHSPRSPDEMRIPHHVKHLARSDVDLHF
ncbi:MAG: hypothetical protein OEV49_01305 [candidate division Zixibacteria bacterium]|nr:hypothetical protein [candidate division Zixibacteria bacterium]MDH3938754.1 hypothetical protein [candidate division Zixibacteria bacterium]MDH4032807.1 hypothetical protein [candidate division Zixibacteria bacterium]